MKLIKTTIFSAVITLVKTIAGFVSTKFVAVYIGPAGVALVGQFINFISIILTFANGAINTGVVKYTAEYDGDIPKLKTLFSNAFKISVFSSVCVGILLVAFAPFWSNWVLHSYQYTNPIRALGIGAILYALNTLLVSILNGQKQIKEYTIVNVAGSLLALVFTILMVYFYRIEGALYALALSQSVLFFITVIFVIKSPWFHAEFFLQKFDKKTALNLGGFALMSIVSVLTLPVAQMILRGTIITYCGLPSAGCWQGLMRISDAYLLVVMTGLGTYYLPKLSSLKTNVLIRKEILHGYKIILPFVLISCFLLYILRLYIINILYTNEFVEMKDLFFYQLLGDFFKIAAFLLAYVMQAKAMTKTYIVTEIVFTFLYVVMGIILIPQIGIRGVVIAFCINYFLYLVTMIFIFRKLLFNKNIIHENITGR